VATVFLGSLLGLLIRSRISEGMKDQILNGIGLVTILIGVQMGLKTENIQEFFIRNGCYNVVFN